MPQNRGREQRLQTGEPVASERVAQVILAGTDRALHRLHRHIAGKSVGHDDVGLTRHQVVAFDKADVVECAGAQQRGRILDCLVTLDVLGADVQQRNAWILDAIDIRSDERAHHGVLEQLLGRRLRVGAEVQHVDGTRLGRNLGYDRRAIDAGQHLENELCRGHQGAGVAGTDTRIRRPVFDEVDRHAHGRVFLAAQRIRRRLRHGDDFAGVLHAQP